MALVSGKTALLRTSSEELTSQLEKQVKVNEKLPDIVNRTSSETKILEIQQDILNNTLKKAIEGEKAYEQALKDQAEQVRLVRQEESFNEQQLKDSEAAYGDIVKVSNGYFKVLEDGNRIFVKNVVETKKVVDTQKELKDELKRAEEATIKATKAFLDYEIAMEDIASNERIRTLELTVDLKVAQIEAETKQITAAFESIGETFGSTTQLIGDLASVFAGLDSNTRASNTIEEYMERNQILAEKQIEKQGELIDAQIRKMEASTERMQSGEALLTVDGGDLKPELQAIMESLFASIRIEMSQTYEDYLVGVGS